MSTSVRALRHKTMSRRPQKVSKTTDGDREGHNEADRAVREPCRDRPAAGRRHGQFDPSEASIRSNCTTQVLHHTRRDGTPSRPPCGRPVAARLPDGPVRLIVEFSFTSLVLLVFCGHSRVIVSSHASSAGLSVFHMHTHTLPIPRASRMREGEKRKRSVCVCVYVYVCMCMCVTVCVCVCVMCDV